MPVLSRIHPTSFDENSVERMMFDAYGISATAKRLVGEYDLNFLMQSNENRYLLKIARLDATREEIEFQNSALDHVASTFSSGVLPVQRVLPALSGQSIAEVHTESGIRLVRVLSFLEGRVLADVSPHTPELLESLGTIVAEVDRSLMGFSHPFAGREFKWNLTQSYGMLPKLDCIDHLEHRAIAARNLEHFASVLRPRLAELPDNIIHGDANDHNVVVTGVGYEARVSGLIDFGDAMLAPTICGLAIALAYAMLKKPDPLSSAAHVVRGYQRIRPLNNLELELLYPLSLTRLAVSVTNSATEKRLRPDDPYITVTEAPAWALLAQMENVDPRSALKVFRSACNAETVPDSQFMSKEKILSQRRKSIGRNLSISYREPLYITQGQGQYLFDEHAQRYLDCYNNVPHVGHCHPQVVESAQRQLAILDTNTRYLHENLVRYAQRLTSKLPEPLSVCYFVSSGSEATELALRLAQAHTQQRDLIVSDHAYHGHTTTLIDISPYKAEGPGGMGLPDWVHKLQVPDDYRGPYQRGLANLGECYASDVDPIIAKIEKAGRGLRGFIIESIPSVAGQIVLPTGYLQAVYQRVRATGGVCIADEVQTGFGRIGSHFWGFEHQGVVPDIVAMGKPIGNGFPLGAVVTTPEIAASFDNGMEFFATFGGNPVACAVGIAVLDVLERENLQSHALELGNYLMDGLRSLQQKHEVIGDVRGLGLFNGIELVQDRATKKPAPQQTLYVTNRLRDCHILTGTDGAFHNVIKLRGPMVLTKLDVDALLTTLDLILHEDAAKA